MYYHIERIDEHNTLQQQLISTNQTFTLWSKPVSSLNSLLNYIQQDTYKFLNHLKELLVGDNDDLTRCPADLAPGDGLLPAGDNLFLMGRKLLPGGDP